MDLAGLPRCHISRFGVIPKGHNTGKWRLILDLSYPPGESINDGIDPALCSLSYTLVDHVADVVARYQKGALLAKIDIEAAYRLVPVHPHDRPLQAMHWAGEVYIDPMLPFGLRSAPKIFNAIADGLEWYLRQLGIQHVFHYLDDFIVIGPPGSVQCAEEMASLNRACALLGVPIATHKTEGPTTCLTYLGIEIDTKARWYGGTVRALVPSEDDQPPPHSPHASTPSPSDPPQQGIQSRPGMVASVRDRMEWDVNPTSPPAPAE